MVEKDLEHDNKINKGWLKLTKLNELTGEKAKLKYQQVNLGVPAKSQTRQKSNSN